MYGKAIKSVGKSAEHYRSAAVAYMTINMTLNSIQSDSNSLPHTVQQSQCEQWLEKQTKDDSANASLLASVEIIGAGKMFCNVIDICVVCSCVLLCVVSCGTFNVAVDRYIIIIIITITIIIILSSSSYHHNHHHHHHHLSSNRITFLIYHRRPYTERLLPSPHLRVHVLVIPRGAEGERIINLQKQQRITRRKTG